MSEQAKSGTAPRFPQILLLVLVLIGALAFLFRGAIPPDYTVASNDSPLGALSARWGDLPGAFSGVWQDLNWLGVSIPTGLPDITLGLCLVTGKLLFSKVFAPFSVFFLGVCVWFCFKQWKFSPLACFLAGIAGCLNADFFSTACWGVAAQPIAFGFSFLALAALADDESPRRWARLALAGFAVGMGVMEAFDNGAIFSLVIAFFVLYQALIKKGTPTGNLATGFLRIGAMAGFAAFIAAAALGTLIGTQIKGVAVDPNPQERWDRATQWSLPKRETVGLLIPGLYGYRMDTPDGGQYWSIGGRDPAWDRYFASGKQGNPPAGRLLRFSGGGHYAGVLVVMLALWAVLQSLRKKGSPFSDRDRKFVWFWSILALASLLFAYGRFAPFYQLFYALPLAATIRNPAKFIHVVEFSIIILFGYGADAICRKYLEGATNTASSLLDHVKAWWSQVRGFDRKWVLGMVFVLGASLVGWLIYASSKGSIVAYMQEVGFDPSVTGPMADFSIRQPGWFILFLTLTGVLMVVILSGYFRGRKARWAWILMAVLLVVDLGRANAPWVVTYNWKEKYASNALLDYLRQKPYEGRVTIVPFQGSSQTGLLREMYGIEWAQHQFQYYNIQSLDVVQMPREPVDRTVYESAFRFDGTTNTVHLIARHWQLTNTRYLLGMAGFVEGMNQQLDPVQKSFHSVLRFDLVPKPNHPQPRSVDELTVVADTNGPFAIIEYGGTLPRASLYAHWQVSTNDTATIERLTSRDFDPTQTLLVGNQIPPSEPGATNGSAGTVDFVSYAPKDIRLHAKATRASVLLLNDRYDPNWRVTLDGQPTTLLRCNYLMRGVQVPPGDHEIRFVFAPPLTGLYVSLLALGVGIGLLGFLALRPEKHTPSA